MGGHDSLKVRGTSEINTKPKLLALIAMSMYQKKTAYGKGVYGINGWAFRA